MTTTSIDTEPFFEQLEIALAGHTTELVELSHALHDDPELGSEEFRACARITAVLKAAGFEIGPTPAGLPTAFVARAGSSPLVAALCVEYDALPEIGHGCGHNVNATTALGAALALRPILEDIGLSLVVLGTPAEESTGAKVDLINLGYFDDVSFAMMAHASPQDVVGTSSLALTCWEISYVGQPSHAAAAPEMGVNALNALLVAQTAIALERQQLPRDSIVSTNISSGGTAVNVIPAYASALVEMRSPTFEGLQVIKDRIQRCLDAGAVATGCRLHTKVSGNDFADLRQDADLTAIYQRVMTRRGREVPLSSQLGGSTDMGNVSLKVPSIHPMIGFDAEGASLHSAQFATAAVSASADEAIIDGAFGLAATAVEVALDPQQRGRLIGND